MTIELTKSAFVADGPEGGIPKALLELYAYLDLEVDQCDRIFRYGFVSSTHSVNASTDQADEVYQQLVQLQSLEGILCGHNIRRFDYPHLTRQWPDLNQLLIIDTLELSVLAYPLAASHRLQKDYKLSDYTSNDPLEDALATQQLLNDCLSVLADHPLQSAIHWLLTCGSTPVDCAYQTLFDHVSWPETEVISLDGLPSFALTGMDLTHLAPLWRDAPTLAFDQRLALAALLSWNQACLTPEHSSVQPLPAFSLWLSHLPGFGQILHQIFPLTPTGFTYQPYLKAFGIEQFRSLQESAVQAVIAGQNPIILMPTGGGKSLCYQLPALMHFRRQRGLTLCISPLQALMSDQVADLTDQGLDFATYINSTLPAEVRAERLEALRNGQKGLLYIGPEQLRSVSIRTLLRDRPPALWIIDEGHCISQWGHDFRPDYRYIPKFIQSLYQSRSTDPSDDSLSTPLRPHLALLTATATPQVRQDIRALFDAHGLPLGPDITTEMVRDNLTYDVIPVRGRKDAVLIETLQSSLAQGGCALIYTTTRREAARLATQLQQAGFQADYYHGRLSRDRKASILEQFKRGALNVVAATCAFGMGINRADVRAVIHYTPSSSLEGYIQEAGRAGRDQAPATCTLLFDPQDTETIFFLKSQNRLSKADLRNLFVAIRQVRDNLSRERVIEDWFWVTSEELYQSSALDDDFADTEYRDTKIRVALHHLETFGLIERAENLSTTVQVNLHLATPTQARQTFNAYAQGQDFNLRERQQFQNLIDGLYLMQHQHQRYGEHLSLERLSDESGIAIADLPGRIRELKQAHICTSKIPLTLLVTKGVKGDARLAYNRYCTLEDHLLEQLILRTAQSSQPQDPRTSLATSSSTAYQISLRALASAIDAATTATQSQPRPRASNLLTLLEGWQALSWIRFKRLNSGSIQLLPIDETSGLLDRVIERLLNHQQACRSLLDCLYALLDQQGNTTRGARIALKTEFEDLLINVSNHQHPTDLDAQRLKRLLRWMHERAFFRLTDGVMLFHQALKVKVIKGASIGSIDRQYPALEKRYAEQARRTHLMVKYGQLEPLQTRQQLVDDYFTLTREAFAAKHPDLFSESAERPVNQQDYEAIMGPLNDNQRAIVTAEESAMAIIAGPGSGKTRTLVHRIAYLVRVKRVNPDRILVLAYNRNAVRELRIRLKALVGPLAARLRVYTFHGLALSLLGRTLEEPPSQRKIASSSSSPDLQFQTLLQEACDLIESGDEAGTIGGDLDEAIQVRRTRLLGNTEHIFVDEYQDVAEQEYRLIQLLSGLGDSESRSQAVQINLCVIGDDDQNIYAFRGTTPHYIRQFRAEYCAHQALLTENYRSTETIIAAANRLIQHNQSRHKRQPHEQVRINQARQGLQGAPAYGWQFSNRLEQASWIARQVQSWVKEGTRPCQIAILARHWDLLDDVRAILENQVGLSTYSLKGRDIKLMRRGVTQQLLFALDKDKNLTLSPSDSVLARFVSFFERISRDTHEPTVKLLLKIAEDIDQERGYGDPEVSEPITAEEIKTALYEFNESPNNTLIDPDSILVTSCHGAKGLEFNRVILLTDGFSTDISTLEAERRLFYVAMTRAQQSLALCGTHASPFAEETQIPIQKMTSQTTSASAGLLPDFIYYADLCPGDVNLGCATTRDNQPLIKTIHEGATLQLQANRYRDGWTILTAEGLEIGALSKAAYRTLGEKGIQPGLFYFKASEVSVLHIYRHLKVDPVAHRIQEDWFVVVPQIRVYR